MEYVLYFSAETRSSWQHLARYVCLISYITVYDCMMYNLYYNHHGTNLRSVSPNIALGDNNILMWRGLNKKEGVEGRLTVI